MAKKKNFLDNVPAAPVEALSNVSAVDPFISELSKPNESETAQPGAATSSNELNPQPIDKNSAKALLNPPGEKKEKHFHLVLKPSLFKRIETASSRSKVSMNKFLTVGAELLLSSIEGKSNQ